MPIKKNLSSDESSKTKDSSPKTKLSSTKLPQHQGGCCSEPSHEKKSHQEHLPLSSGCCKETNHSQDSSSHLHAPTTPVNGKLETKKGNKTKIVVRYDVGFQNSLTIRGKGANLTWDKGTPLKNIKHDEWVWETDAPFANGEFKILINDHHYEAGPNHLLSCGASIQYTPKF